MLPDGESRPCKPIAMKNLEDILKGIYGFIQYWESLKVVDVGGSCWHRYRSWIHYWTRVCVALADLHQDSSDTLRHGFWPQTRVDVQASGRAYWKTERFVKNSIRTTIMLGPLVNVLYHLSALRLIVMKVTCLFCVLGMKHM
jgi:hypothetical protein